MFTNIYKSVVIIFSGIAFFSACSAQIKSSVEKENDEIITQPNAVAYFASGCFWCVESIFESLQGVDEVISGYAGGTAGDANYRAVSAGITDHAETVAIHYDSTIIDFATLLEVFFASHDPTTVNQQGPDRGRHYRSAIFYRNDEEKKLAANYIDQLLAENVFSRITTEVTKFEAFYKAEEYHQDYEMKNPRDPYVCRVSIPRLHAFQKKYPELLKSKN